MRWEEGGVGGEEGGVGWEEGGVGGEEGGVGGEEGGVGGEEGGVGWEVKFKRTLLILVSAPIYADVRSHPCTEIV